MIRVEIRYPLNNVQRGYTSVNTNFHNDLPAVHIDRFSIKVTDFRGSLTEDSRSRVADVACGLQICSLCSSLLYGIRCRLKMLSILIERSPI